MSLPLTPTDLEAAERRARHLDLVQETQEVAANLMRAAAAKAERALAQDDPPDAPKSAPRQDPVLAVTRLIRILHHAIALENRVANGDTARPRRTFRPVPPPDARRDLFRSEFQRLFRNRKFSDQARRMREVDERIEAVLESDPAKQIAPLDLLEAIAADLHIKLEPKWLSDEVLGMPPRIYPDDPRPPEHRHNNRLNL